MPGRLQGAAGTRGIGPIRRVLAAKTRPVQEVCRQGVSIGFVAQLSELEEILLDRSLRHAVAQQAGGIRRVAAAFRRAKDRSGGTEATRAKVFPDRCGIHVTDHGVGIVKPVEVSCANPGQCFTILSQHGGSGDQKWFSVHRVSNRDGLSGHNDALVGQVEVPDRTFRRKGRLWDLLGEHGSIKQDRSTCARSGGRRGGDDLRRGERADGAERCQHRREAHLGSPRAGWVD